MQCFVEEASESAAVALSLLLFLCSCKAQPGRPWTRDGMASHGIALTDGRWRHNSDLFTPGHS